MRCFCWRLILSVFRETRLFVADNLIFVAVGLFVPGVTRVLELPRHSHHGQLDYLDDRQYHADVFHRAWRSLSWLSGRRRWFLLGVAAHRLRSDHGFLGRRENILQKDRVGLSISLRAALLDERYRGALGPRRRRRTTDPCRRHRRADIDGRNFSDHPLSSRARSSFWPPAAGMRAGSSGRESSPAVRFCSCTSPSAWSGSRSSRRWSTATPCLSRCLDAVDGARRSKPSRRANSPVPRWWSRGFLRCRSGRIRRTRMEDRGLRMALRRPRSSIRYLPSSARAAGSKQKNRSIYLPTPPTVNDSDASSLLSSLLMRDAAVRVLATVSCCRRAWRRRFHVH